MKDRNPYWKIWAKANPDKVHAAQVRYREKHRTRILAERRARYAADPSIRRDADKRWHLANPERSKKTRDAWNHKNRARNLFSFAKCRAKRKGISFTLKREDVVIPKRCPVFGFRLTTKIKKGDRRSPSVDRVNPKRGYTKKNTRVISLRANLLKNNGTLAEFKAIVKWLKQNS